MNRECVERMRTYLISSSRSRAFWLAPNSAGWDLKPIDPFLGDWKGVEEEEGDEATSL
jgi:hypothetical protein